MATSTVSSPSSGIDIDPTAFLGLEDDAASGNSGADESTLAVEELLVEEVSIDGMCGVY